MADTKQEAMQLFFSSERKRILIEELTHRAIEVCNRVGSVTVDDLRNIPLPKGTDARIYGGVFAQRMFQPIDWTTTKVRTSHSRPIRVFKLRHNNASKEI